MSKFTRNFLARYMSEASDGADGSASGGSLSDNSSDAGNVVNSVSDANNTSGDTGKKAGEQSKTSGESDSKGKLSDEEARLLKEVMKKKESLDKTQSELAQAKEQLKKFEGIDADSVRALLKERESAEKQQLEAKGDWERLKQRMAEEHAKEIDSLKNSVTENQTNLQKALSTINELSVGTQFSQSKLISEELTLTPSKARVIYGDYFDVVDGKVIGYDKPKGAENRTAIVDQYGNNVGFDEALRKVVESDPDKDFLFKSKAKPGAGSDSNKPTGRQDNKASELDGIGRIAAGLKTLGKPGGSVI